MKKEELAELVDIIAELDAVAVKRGASLLDNPVTFALNESGLPEAVITLSLGVTQEEAH
jgi:hypothetical protein